MIFVDSSHAGTDEVGRGCLIGDVYAAAVILPAHFHLPELNDSKKLSEKKRNRLALAIREHATAYCIARANTSEIETLNILHASMLAMSRAINGLNIQPQKVWVDGNRIPTGLNIQAQAIIQGDSKIVQIAAASILAKVARDAQMYALAQRYPQYGFDHHKGYPTKAHLRALKQYGILPEHRRSYAPIKKLAAEGKLFQD